MAGVAGALAISAAVATLTAAHAAPGDPSPTASPTATSSDDTMPSAVEDFAYPGAAKIFQEKQILLKRGDGHILLTDCKSTHAIMVESRTAQKQFCFAVSGKQGELTLELPDAYGIWTQDHPVEAKVKNGEKETVVEAAKNDYKPIGESVTTGKPSILVELRVTG
ncbi:hypothetical protein AAW14_37220 [Streptomyces hygroscopicus]|uniref:hypothetical protein n=1 Tax=Streptomyces hygroscopicus TaxID=1912 RepID=UPI00223E9B72|nr:hypothetical protein [Streptomyces hygroscopicus]MCW7947418.1 hypothetical protein [Streptomyces hygroscopicus]